MHSGGISIWFFIGISLVVNGALIAAAGIYELFVPPENPVVLFHLHANVWWGGLLLMVGIIYSYRFAPSRQKISHEEPAPERQTNPISAP
jgi:hypothetical protein